MSINKTRVLQIVAVNAAIFVVLLAILEAVLARFFPYQMVTIGHRDSPNARIYGWGFNPHERVVVIDPDNWEYYESNVSSHGWRDREHSYENAAES